MNILFIGDVYGSPGRDTVEKVLPDLIKKDKIDLVICNAENVAHGTGITKKTVSQLFYSGVDVCTGGNHIFKKDGIAILKEGELSILRPLNFPEGAPGEGYKIIKKKGKKIMIVNIMGRVFMPYDIECPFKAMDKLLEDTKDEKIDYIFVDFHAEATSEKSAMKYYLDGRVTSVFGTHTHVQTADLHITEKGTSFITDVGMVGTLDDSVLGVKSDVIIQKFLTSMGAAHQVAEDGKKIFAAVLVKLDKTKYAKQADLIRIILE